MLSFKFNLQKNDIIKSFIKIIKNKKEKKNTSINFAEFNTECSNSKIEQLCDCQILILCISNFRTRF